MVHIALNFDENTLTSMREAARHIAGGSPFQPSDKLNVALIGSLHSYAKEEIQQGAFGLLSPSTTVKGRFLRWGIESDHLRAFVEVEGVADLHRNVQKALPRGRPWRELYVQLGSVKPIEVSKREGFLQAVEAAFPIDSSSIFEMRAMLEYPDSHPNTARRSVQHDKRPPGSKACHPAKPGKEVQLPGGIDGLIRAAAKSNQIAHGGRCKTRSAKKRAVRAVKREHSRQMAQIAGVSKLDVAMTSVPKATIRKRASKLGRPRHH